MSDDTEMSRRSLFPTPTSCDAKGSRRSSARKPHWTSKEGTTLLDAVLSGEGPTTGATSSSADSPVSRSAKQAGGSRPPTTDGYGRICVEFSKWSPRDGYWSRTSPGCCQSMMDGSSEPFSETWPRSGILSSGTAFRRAPLVPRTYATGSSLSAGEQVPTPSARGFEATDIPNLLARRQRVKAKGYNANGFGLTLNQWAKLWPTPRACEGDHPPMGPRGKGLEQAVKAEWFTTPTVGDADITKPDPRPSRAATGRTTEYLARQVMMFPTPTKADAERKGADFARFDRPESGGPDLQTAVRLLPTPDAGCWRQAGNPGQRRWQLNDPEMGITPVGGQLSADWVELLMGFPMGWSSPDTTLGPTAGKSESPDSPPTSPTDAPA